MDCPPVSDLEPHIFWVKINTTYNETGGSFNDIPSEIQYPVKVEICFQINGDGAKLL